MKKLLLIAGVMIIAGISVILFTGGERAVDPETPGAGLPFGSGEGINIPALGTETVGESTPFDENASSEAQIFRLSNTPTAGFVTFSRGQETLVRYVERSTGHIFEAKLPKAGSREALEKIKVTNETLPKIYEAHFRADGGAVLLRSLTEDSDVVKNLTLVLSATKASSTEEALSKVTATNLRGDIDSLVVGGNALFYSLKNSGNIVSSSLTGEGQKILFTSPFTNWRVGRLGNNLLIYPKASTRALGYLYSLSASGGSPVKILGPLPGLTGLANNPGNRVLYSYSDGSQTKLFVKNLPNNTISEILPATLSEKCVWSGKEVSAFFCGIPVETLSGHEPDNWYLGRTHFADYLWKFNSDSEVAELLAQPKTDFGLDLDVSELQVTPNEDFLLFINKRDQTLWVLRLR